MKVRYDRKADILYLKLSDLKAVDSDMMDDDVVVSFDENGEIVSIEIWRVRELILPAFLEYLEKMKKAV